MLKKKNTLLRQQIVCYALFFAVFGAGMAYGTFRDLQVDQALLRYSDLFGRFMEHYAVFPQYTVRALACAALLSTFGRTGNTLTRLACFAPVFEKVRGRRVLYVLFFAAHKVVYALLLCGAFDGADTCLNFISGNLLGKEVQDVLIGFGLPYGPAVAVWIGVRFGFIAVCVLIFLLLRKKLPDLWKGCVFAAAAGLSLLLGSRVIDVLKGIFHRVRFREMIAYSHGLIAENGWTQRGGADLPRAWIADTDFSAFTRWYVPGNDRGVYTDATSFPSGHTTAAAFTMLLAPLFAHAGKFRKLFVPAFAVGFCYTLAMAVSRLMRGAHYLTDVCAAALIMCGMMLLISLLLDFGLEKGIFEKSAE